MNFIQQKTLWIIKKIEIRLYDFMLTYYLYLLVLLLVSTANKHTSK